MSPTHIRLAILTLGFVFMLAPAAQAAFPGANGKVAVTVRDTDDDQFLLCLHRPDLSRDNCPIAGFTHGIDPIHVSWSPDGTKLAVSARLTTGLREENVYIADPNGVILDNLTDNPPGSDRDDSYPAWSAAGDRIAFESNRDGNSEIYSMAPDGTDPVRLTTNSAVDSGPDWSPDGSKIAFSSSRDGAEDIYVMNADGTGVVNLTNTPTGLERGPDWSPDGRAIVFSANYDERDDHVERMDADGSNRVSFDSAFETDPAWSPDGKTIINGCSTSFCVRDADGGDQGFAASFGFVGDTDWQPVGAFAPYPRPATATPTRLALVPAFTQCTNPDSAHVAPLSLPACSAPSQVSNLLTTSSIGRGFGYVLLRAALGDFSTPADEADLLIRTSATDVRNTSDGSDYTGQLLLSLEGTRITDRSSGFGGVSATASDFTFSAPVDCAATAGAAGSACFLNTTADALLPGTVKENKNTVLRIGNAHFSDAGADGMSGGSSCPPTCGTGDEKVYLEQGVFTP